MNSAEDLYKFLYNELVKISNGEVITIHYLIGPKWNVCNYNDTVKIAKDTIKFIQLHANEITNLKSERSTYLKISKMFDSLIKISLAKKDSWDDGLFDEVYYYYADDTVFEAQKCLKIINEYI